MNVCGACTLARSIKLAKCLYSGMVMHVMQKKRQIGLSTHGIRVPWGVTASSKQVGLALVSESSAVKQRRQAVSKKNPLSSYN